MGPGSRSVSISAIACLLLSACGGAWSDPTNSSDFSSGGGYMAERRNVPSRRTSPDATSDVLNAKRCGPQAPPMDGVPSGPRAIANQDMPLSPGDVVQVTLPASEAPSGTYKVGDDGILRLDSLGDYPVEGLSIQKLQEVVSGRLVATRYYRPGHVRASVRLLERASVNIQVSGAVFQPGQATINEVAFEKRDPLSQSAAGDHAAGRTLSAAISNAGGARPDADLSRVSVVRGGVRQEFDLRGFFTGGKVLDPTLAQGDLVEVPGRGCFQASLARPSPVTPPGIRVFVSNLTIPAIDNAASAVGKESTALPYGSRMLQALVAGNCVGGTQSTNADRYAVLMSSDPATGESEVVERRIEDLVRRPDRRSYDPVLLPGDAIACYDSGVTNIRDVLRAATESLSGLVGSKK